MPPQHDRPSFSLTQLAVSALAAASAAFAASYLGVAGTIIGAAVASVVATIATATYSASLQRSREVVRRTALVVRPAGNPPARAPVLDPGAPDRGPEPFGATADPVGHSSWRRTAWTAAAALVLSLAVLTGVEGVLGKPLSSVLDGSSGQGTSVGSALAKSSGNSGTSRGNQTDPPALDAPVPTPAPTPTQTQTPTGQPDQTDQPSSPPSEDPGSDPDDSATAVPTPPAPTEPASAATPDPAP